MKATEGKKRNDKQDDAIFVYFQPAWIGSNCKYISQNEKSCESWTGVADGFFETILESSLSSCHGAIPT